MIRFLGAFSHFASLAWAAFYIYEATVVGEFISWRFTAADWAQIVLVGVGPLGLAVAATAVARNFASRLRITN